MIRSIRIADLDFFQDDSNVAGKVQLEHGIHYERHVVAELREWLPSSIGFADIGCNAGIHTIIAQSIRKGIPTVCAEASPSNVQLLLRNILGNGLTDISVLPFAISNAHRIIAINGCYFNSHCSVLMDPGHQIPCVAFPLNMLKLPPVDLIKLDVEGFELLALEGATKLIAYYMPRVIFEYCPEHISMSGRAPEELLHFFLDRNYKLTVLDYLPGMRRECFTPKEVHAQMAAWKTNITDLIAEPK